MKINLFNPLSTGACDRQTSLIFAVLLSLCTLCISCEKDVPTNSTLSGIVLDSNQKSIANVKVVLLQTTGAKDSTTTSANGSFSFTNLGYHPYSLIVSKTGYKPNECLFILDGRNNQSKNITLLTMVETAIFKIDPKTVTFNYKINESFTNITSNMAWSCSDTVSWVEMLVVDGRGNKTIHFSVKENISASDRKAVFIFKSGYDKKDSITIIQKGSPGPYPTLVATNFNSDSVNVNNKMYLLFDQKVILKSISFGAYTLPASDLIPESFAEGKGLRFTNLSIPLCGNLNVAYTVIDAKAPERNVTGSFSLKTFTNSFSTAGVIDLTFNNNKNMLWWINRYTSTFKRLDLNAAVPEIKSTQFKNYYVRLAYNPANDMMYSTYASSNTLYKYNISSGVLVDSVKKPINIPPINSFAFTKSGVGILMTDFGFYAIETMNNNVTTKITQASVFKSTSSGTSSLVVDKILSSMIDEVCIVTSSNSTKYGFINANGGNCYLNQPTDYPDTFSPTVDGRYLLTTVSEKSIINPQTNISEALTNVEGFFATPTYFDSNSNIILTASGTTLKLTNRSTNQVINIKTYGDGDIKNIIYPMNSDYFIIEKNSMYWIVKKSILKP